MNVERLPIYLGILVLPIIWTLTRPAERALLVRTAWQAWPVVRPILGWISLIVGVLGVILPILQGVIFLVIGAALIGPRHWVVRGTRVRYKLLLQRMVRSRHRPVRWLGGYGQRSLRLLNTQIRKFVQRQTGRAQARRRFRVALVPDEPACRSLNHWRRLYDPGYQHRLPPHLVLLAADRSPNRPLIEQCLAQLCSQVAPFFLSLEAVKLCADDHRIVATVGEGTAEVEHLRVALAEAIPVAVRFSQRPVWPAITLAKLRQERSLRSAYAEVAAHFTPQRWQATTLILFEERWGYTWHAVRQFQFSGSSARSNAASLLIVEEVL